MRGAHGYTFIKMISAILKAIIQNPKFFFWSWIAVIAANQIFVFGACFAIYCLLAALPHTSIIAVFVTYFYHKDENEDDDFEGIKQLKNDNNRPKKDAISIVEATNSEQPVVVSKILCPNCGASMQIRTAKRGRYSGKQFLGCSKFPQCNGLVNIE